jgi:hypothetical protein
MNPGTPHFLIVGLKKRSLSKCQINKRQINSCMTHSADKRLDRAIYGLFEQHIPIRKMLHVEQNLCSYCPLREGNRSLPYAWPKNTIQPGAVQIIEALILGDASMSTARIKGYTGRSSRNGHQGKA